MSCQIEVFLASMAAARRSFMRGNPKPKGFRYRSLDELILKFGMQYTPARLPTDIEMGEPKMCYMNSAVLALEQPERFTYVEGYAAGIIPVLHAWVAESGMAIDTTWKDGEEYFGIPIRHDYLRKSLLKNGFYGILDNWMGGYPILKDNPKSFLA